MADADSLEVRIDRLDTAVIVRPFGDVDLARSPVLRRHLTEIHSQRPARLIVDLSNVPYMDSSGVATLIEAMQRARQVRTRLVLCSLQPRVRSIFEIARLEMVFPIVATVDDALRA